MTEREQIEHAHQQLQEALDAAYENMLAFKRYKRTPVVVVREGKVVEVSPDSLTPVAQTAA
ncbi:hypothetical protein ABIB60_001938 [Hymenobacter sp. UYP22]